MLADPGDPDGLYVINRKLWRSSDGGRSYRQGNVPYVDQMELWVDPQEPSRMALGNDGGAAVSFDAGEPWSTLINQPTAEIYRVAADTHFPYRIYGSQQDNSTLCLPSRSERGKISAMEWYDVGGARVASSRSARIIPTSFSPAIYPASASPGTTTRPSRSGSQLGTDGMGSLTAMPVKLEMAGSKGIGYAG